MRSGVWYYDGIKTGLSDSPCRQTNNDCESESCLAADFNGDGRVDGFDMGLFLSAWGNDCTGG